MKLSLPPTKTKASGPPKSPLNMGIYRNKRIAVLLRQGVAVRKIADMIGCSSQHVRFVRQHYKKAL